ncbi:hypothetical protein C8R46DRAFT_1193951 [Mycena filopes]|nr:hypothetical protein C8R46DRAFT_1193951 [Mycena filopes]
MKMEEIMAHHDDLFYATFPDARPSPRSKQVEAEHARMFAPPELSLVVEPLHDAHPLLAYGFEGGEYAYPDPQGWAFLPSVWPSAAAASQEPPRLALRLGQQHVETPAYTHSASPPPDYNPDPDAAAASSSSYATYGTPPPLSAVSDGSYSSAASGSPVDAFGTGTGNGNDNYPMQDGGAAAAAYYQPAYDGGAGYDAYAVPTAPPLPLPLPYPPLQQGYPAPVSVPYAYPPYASSSSHNLSPLEPPHPHSSSSLAASLSPLEHAHPAQHHQARSSHPPHPHHPHPLAPQPALDQLGRGLDPNNGSGRRRGTARANRRNLAPPKRRSGYYPASPLVSSVIALREAASASSNTSDNVNSFAATEGGVEGNGESDLSDDDEGEEQEGEEGSEEQDEHEGGEEEPNANGKRALSLSPLSPSTSKRHSHSRSPERERGGKQRERGGKDKEVNGKEKGGARRKSSTSTSTAAGAGGAPKKPPLACLFCRGRKIACGPGSAPLGSGTGTGGCNQCQRRALKCEYPAESRRGMRKKKTGDAAVSSTPGATNTTAGAATGAGGEGSGEGQGGNAVASGSGSGQQKEGVEAGALVNANDSAASTMGTSGSTMGTGTSSSALAGAVDFTISSNTNAATTSSTTSNVPASASVPTGVTLVTIAPSASSSATPVPVPIVVSGGRTRDPRLASAVRDAGGGVPLPYKAMAGRKTDSNSKHFYAAIDGRRRIERNSIPVHMIPPLLCLLSVSPRSVSSLSPPLRLLNRLFRLLLALINSSSTRLVSSSRLLAALALASLSIPLITLPTLSLHTTY